MNSTERLGAWIANNPIIIMAIAVLLTFASFHYAQQIEVKGFETESFVGKESPLYQIFDHLFVERFGTESIVVLIEGEDVAAVPVLEATLRLSDNMKESPGVLGVQSIADIVADAEASDSGVRRIPEQEKVDSILAAQDPLVLEGIMPDRKHTMLAVETPMYLTDKDRAEILSEAQAAADMAEFPPDIGLTLTGSAALSDSIVAEMNKSNGPLMAIACVLMVVALFLVFGHVKWRLLPLPIVFLGIIWTFGAMGFFHIPMTMVSMSAFPILIGIGIDYSIQFHNRIDEEFKKGAPPMVAAVNTVSHVASPVMIALLITAAGFVSLFSSSVPMIREFGLLCLIGLFLCYLSALFVGVTVLYIAERRNGGRKKATVADTGEHRETGEHKDTVVERLLTKSAEICIQRWQAVLVAALALSLLGVYADTQVPVDTDFRNYIPQDLPPLVDFRHMSEIFGSDDAIKILVQGDITDPSTLRWMDDFSIYLLGSRAQVKDAVSIATFVKEANGGEIPDDDTRTKEIIDALPDSVKSRFLDGYDTAIIDMNVGETIRDLGAEGTDRLLKEVDKDIAWMTPPPGVSVRQTGDLVVMTTVITALTVGRTEMTLLGLVLIFFILLLVYRDLIKALLPVLPMLVVIGWMGGVMYLTGIKYSPLTATLGALILGVGSEYAILMMERFYEELPKVGDPVEALKITTARIGSALMASGLTTVFGFAALIASPFMMTYNFGLVTVMAVIFALLTTFTVFVVLMLRMEIRRESMENAKQEFLRALKIINARGE
ncbi:MAG: RND family transporter [Methanotrichaceae archaeon]|nr:RND family transporter [Methanotrichaceae archaeon]